MVTLIGSRSQTLAQHCLQDLFKLEKTGSYTNCCIVADNNGFSYVSLILKENKIKTSMDWFVFVPHSSDSLVRTAVWHLLICRRLLESKELEADCWWEVVRNNPFIAIIVTRTHTHKHTPPAHKTSNLNFREGPITHSMITNIQIQSLNLLYLIWINQQGEQHKATLIKGLWLQQQVNRLKTPNRSKHSQKWF